ncbi:MAG: hypothetical protein FGM33_06440 [Candidatus Kapabacteria bacterium]|nr:hypothetical protein [Candidatus Kapabacteria bacterium]
MFKTHTIQRIFSAFAALIIGVLAVNAQMLPVPTEVKALPGQPGTSGSIVTVSWNGITGTDVPMKYYVYQASGVTEDKSKFVRIATIPHSPNTRENRYSFTAQIAKAGTYTFYVSAYWEKTGEGERSAIATAEVKQVETPVIRFVSAPVTLGSVGKAYVYQTKVETSASGPITYKLEVKSATGQHGFVLSDGGKLSWEQPVAGRYEVSITALVTKDGKNYDAKQAFLIVIGEGGDNTFKFLTEPVKFGYVGRPYTYASRAGVANSNVAPTYSLVAGPKGMTIDQRTGLVKWEPTEVGKYEIVIAATIEVNGTVTTIKQSYVLEIKQGDTPKQGCAKITGKVTYDDPAAGGKIEGVVTAWRLEKTDRGGNTTGVYLPVYRAEINADGKYYLYVPDGTYKVRIEGRSFFAEWFDNVTELAEATDVKMACDEIKEINFAVTPRPEPVLIVVEGRVFDAVTNEPVKGLVVFESRSKDVGAADDRYRSVVAEVRGDGTYETKIQSGVNYTAMVRPALTKDLPNASQYLAEFWENTNDATKATVLNLNENTKNINFPMDKRVPRNNGLTGVMKNHYTGAPVVGKVVAHRVVSRTNDKGDTVAKTVVAVSVETNSDGGFMFTDLEPGEYVLLGLPAGRPFVPGWMVLGQKAATEWGKAQRVSVGDIMLTVIYDIQLDTVKGERGKGRVRGFVYDKRGGIISKGSDVVQQSAGITGALVVARDEDGAIIDYSIAENEGAFDLTNLAVGAMTITADRFEFEPVVQTVDISANIPERVVSIGLQSIRSTTSVDVPLNEVGTTVNLWPNPTAADATVRFTATAGQVMIRIVSTSGIELSQLATVVAGGEVSITVPTSDLATGMVMVHVSNGAKTFALPLNIVR